ncbi:MAG: 3-deoxy-D-manno-octulosonic acid transferase [Planctomycetota bacterium]
MRWLLNLAYLSIAGLAAPWLLYRRIVLKKRLGDWRQKFLGSLPPRNSTHPCIWLHAVSVGEVVQLGPVLEQLAARLPGHRFWITTTTTTGHEVAHKLYPQHTVCYFPFDFSWSVARALQRVQPAAIILVELELWPNFIAAAKHRQIPVLLINGRVSDRSYRSYRWIRPLLRRILPQLQQIAVQNQTYADRLVDMGAKPGQVTITGSIKFDRVEVNRDNIRTLEIGETFQLLPEETLLIAGSTQAPEEDLALAAYKTLHAEFPKLRLMLVPRHKERFEEVAALVERQGLPLSLRSLGQGTDSAQTGTLPPVLLLDTLGELSAAWGLAQIAFVGGSLSRRGGQNMIEPAGYGAAVLFGPHTHNFKDVVALLLDANSARVVPTPEEFTSTIRELLSNPEQAQAMGQRAQQLVATQRGATQRTVELILTAIRPDLPAKDASVRAA